MGKRKTKEEIDAEVAALQALLPQARRQRDAIQVQIDVLKNGLSHDQVFDQYEDTSHLDDANDVRMWRDGDSNAAAMSVQWQEML